MQQDIIKLWLISFVTMLLSCNQSHLPTVTRLEKLNKTEFVPALECQLTAHKNVIYAPTFLFAWNKVKQSLKEGIFIDDNNSAGLKLVNLSNSYKNSLTEDEYDAEATIKDNRISASAFFNKSLPFLSKLQKIDGGIIFGTQKVEAFGMNGIDSTIVKFSQILYYKDDDNLILKLIPKDTLNEIIIVKGLSEMKTFTEVIAQTNKLIKNGKQERLNHEHLWKYEFNEEDSFSIPVARFNIETNYKDFEGRTFLSGHQRLIIETAYQRTGFVLDENGAKAESEGRVLDQLDSVSVFKKIHPKTMVFDKPFYIILKHVSRANPYFVMKVDNAELLDKLQKK